MLAVRIFSLLYLFCLIDFQCKSQIIGSYVSENNPVRQEFRFEKNQTFSNKSTDAFEHITYYKEGYYLLQDDTLILVCDNKGRSHSNSVFEVIEKTNQQKFFGQVKAMPESKISIKIVVQDAQNQPLSGATIAFMNGDDIIFAEISDQNGESSIISEGWFIKSMHISLIGYKELKIGLNPLWGYESIIKVQLHPAPDVEYVTDCLEKYLVTKKTRSELNLIKPDGTKIFLLKK